MLATSFVFEYAPTYVLERVDALSGLLNLTTDDLRDQLLGELGKCAGASLPCHDLHHLLADRPNLGRGSVCGLLNLVGPLLGEGNGEKTEEIVVGGLDNNVGLDESLPLADEGAELVGGEVEAVEVSQAVLSLHLIDAQLDLAEGVVLILLEIGEGDFEYPALESIVCVLDTGGAVHEGLSDTVEDMLLTERPLRCRYCAGDTSAAGLLTLGSGKFLGP
jgi:hypothetical protein